MQVQGVDLLFRLSDVDRLYKKQTVTPLTDIPLPAIKYTICMAVDQAISDIQNMGRVQQLYLDALFDEGFSNNQITLLNYLGTAILELCLLNRTIQDTKNPLLCGGDLVVSDAYIYPSIDQIKVTINGWC